MAASTAKCDFFFESVYRIPRYGVKAAARKRRDFVPGERVDERSVL
jgi:hypothetical protein